jgi:hypothetical protein
LRLEEMTEAVPSSRKTIQRRELGSDCNAVAPSAVAIPPQPDHAQLRREVEERKKLESDPNFPTNFHQFPARKDATPIA